VTRRYRTYAERPRDSSSSRANLSPQEEYGQETVQTAGVKLFDDQDLRVRDITVEHTQLSRRMSTFPNPVSKDFQPPNPPYFGENQPKTLRLYPLCKPLKNTLLTSSKLHIRHKRSPTRRRSQCPLPSKPSTRTL
jgi:hypothetical protein